MPAGMRPPAVVLAALALAVGACAGSATSPPVATPGAPADRAPAGAEPCPVTLPVPPDAIPAPAARPIVAGSSGPPGGLRLHMTGNDALWLVVPADGVVRGVPGPGGLAGKLPWVRLAPGRLTVAGRRLDGPAPPARASVPEGYGDAGFQASGVVFPTEGCWEITGTVGARGSLRVVFDVRAAAPRPAAAPAPV